MSYLSHCGFIHRDLAARNCLLDSDLRVKVSDFGLTKQLLNRNYYRLKSPTLLSFNWMAIESLEANIFTLATDVWSYGVLLWEVMSLGDMPYKELQTFTDVLLHLKSGNRLPQPPYSPNSVHELCLKCWSEDPNLRPDFPDIVTELNLIRASYP